MRLPALAAALASTIIASPALAVDNAAYVGVDVGVMKPTTSKIDFDNGLISADNSIRLRHKVGWDADFVVGMDLGMVRVEFETAYKRAGMKSARIDPAPAAAVFALPGRYDNDGRVKVASGMINALGDFSLSETVGASVGGGLGIAGASYRNRFSPSNALSFRGSDRAMAWQLLAEVRAALSPALEARLKYRHFQTTRLNLGDFCEVSCGAIPDFELDGKFRSNSLLVGLVYNFLPPPPAPAAMPLPPAPPPPAMKTCPDGAVIPATSSCPLPPPPPPPPAPVERGERGS